MHTRVGRRQAHVTIRMDAVAGRKSHRQRRVCTAQRRCRVYAYAPITVDIRPRDTTHDRNRVLSRYLGAAA
jgi:hypothetical protein